METIHTIYPGELRTKAKHVFSGTELITDAPLDNQGKAQSFSPTDLMAASLGSCMLTVMGIKARDHNINMDGTEVKITKVMGDKPRRVIEVIVEIQMRKRSYSEQEKVLLQQTAINCPVAKSLHPDLKQTVTFKY